jgi:tetratricopeptide (TPR) repeat protein
MALLVLEMINAGLVEDASEFVQRTQGVYDRATILQLVVRLGIAHYEQGSPDRAELHFQMARKIEPNTVGPEIELGQWHQQRGQWQLAKQQFTAALQRNPNSLPAINNLAWLLATCPEDGVRDGARAVELATQAVRATGARHAEPLDTLAASLAEAGRYEEAERTAARAAELARGASQFNLAGQIQQRRQRFARREAYRLP